MGTSRQATVLPPTPASPERVLVTGANGFLGSYVCRQCADAGSEVLAIIRPGANRSRLPQGTPAIHIKEASLVDAAAVQDAVHYFAPDAVIHLAGSLNLKQGLESAQEVFTANVITALTIATACCKYHTPHLLLAGSCAEYAPQRRPLRETDPLEPRTPYAASKIAAHALATGICAGSQTVITNLRFFTLYGPQEQESRFVSALIDACLRNVPLPMTPGTQRRDYIHVADAAHATLLAASQKPDANAAFNIGSGRAITINTLAKRICHLLECSTALLQRGALPLRPGEFPYLCANRTRACLALQWTPRIPLDDGLRATITWRRHVLGLTTITPDSSQYL
ncbi:MAG: NAD(P)-dependent oxidoreductase [Chloroflexi bacterium]|nr:NAD(P)-dependent oxidoreductase [Chloroflexota bacterium]